MQQERPGAPLPFEACENFRELGGYTGCGGRHVKYGAFYRSPALANIKTPADRARFEALGVRTVFDFRSEKERTLAPDPAFPGVVNIPASAMLAEDGSEVDFDLEKLLRSEDGIRMLTEGVHESYARMPFGNPAYRALFGAIRAGQTPILFHCTAGKDRTGVAAALILKALGVSGRISWRLSIDQCLPHPGRDQFRGMLERRDCPQRNAAGDEIATGVRRRALKCAGRH
ncbi:MAG: tyrosine-protein phosphatase [Ruthenibacterium lactatiformans]